MKWLMDVFDETGETAAIATILTMVKKRYSGKRPMIIFACMRANWLNLVAALLVPFAAGAQLSGTYTIGGANPDYATVEVATADLGLVGASGPVFFDIRPGDYSADELTFYSVWPDFPVTYRSETQNAADVLLTIAALHDCTLLNFEHLTIYPKRIWPNWSHKGLGVSACVSVRFDHCVVRGRPDPDQRIGISVARGAMLTFTNNTFVDLIYGMVYSDAEISGANNHYGTNLIQYNVFDSVGTAIYIAGHVQDSLDVAYNVTTNAGTGVHVVGSMVPAVRAYIHHNRSSGLTEDGVFVFDCSNTSFPLEIYNNMISGGHAEQVVSSGQDTTLTYTSLMSIRLAECAGTRVLNNSLFGGISLAECNAVEVLNNCLYSDTTLLLSIDGASTNYIGDHNNLYRSDGGIMVAYNTFDKYWDLATFQLYSNKELNSVSVDPGYTSSTDLHTSHPVLQFGALPLTRVVDDIDGEMRHPTTPDIGADEFNASPIPPVAWFDHACDGGLSVSFQNMSVVPDNVEWDMGDGSPVLGTYDPLHTFPSAGTYPVRLIVTNAFGADTMVRTVGLIGMDETIAFDGTTMSIPPGHTGYQWFYNGLTIANSDTNAYNPFISGDYSVSYTDTAGCVHTAATFSYGVGLPEDQLQQDISIGPIPADEHLIISAGRTGAQLVEYAIHDATGRVCAKGSSVLPTQLAVGPLQNGAYVLALLLPDGRRCSTNFLVQH